VLFVAGAPSFRHQRVQARLIEKMLRHVDERSLGGIVGRINLYRDKYNYVQPDISYFTEAQVSILDGEQAVHLVPLLVVELLSPSTAHHDRNDKRRWYAELGVQEYWLVDCDARSIEVIDLRTDEARVEDPVRSTGLPDLILPVSGIFS